MDKSFWWALLTFGVAGITDGMDGLIARIAHQRTELGAYLDPIADKLLLSSAFITLAIVEILPNWLTVIVITRDVIILLGILVMILIDQPPKIQPSLISKVTTVLQIATILLPLMAGYYSISDQLLTIAIYGTGLFTVLSGSHYIYVGTRMLNEKK
jgi:cardiolipin synthase